MRSKNRGQMTHLQIYSTFLKEILLKPISRYLGKTGLKQINPLLVWTISSGEKATIQLRLLITRAQQIFKISTKTSPSNNGKFLLLEIPLMNLQETRQTGISNLKEILNLHKDWTLNCKDLHNRLPKTTSISKLETPTTFPRIETKISHLSKE